MRNSYLTLISISALCVSCGGDSDDKDSKASTTSPSSTTGLPSTTTTSPSNSTTAAGPTSGTGGGSGGSTSAGGSGGTTTTTSVGGSAGDNAGGSAGDNSGGSAGAPGGTGGGGAGGGTVVIAEDCGYEACGGDLADTDWSYSRVCVEEGALLGRFEDACDSLEVISSGGVVSGTISFDADSYDQNVSLSITAEISVPAACNPLGCTFTAAALTAAGLTEVDCPVAGGGCLCTGTLSGESTASGSEYTTDGDDITLDTVDATYCASGDSFKYTGEIEMVPFVFETVPQ